MTVSLDSLLIGYYDTKAGVTNSTSSAGTKTVANRPTPPWSQTSSSSTTSTPSAATSLAQSIVNGQPLIDPSTAKLTVTSKNAATNSDYQSLFALYKGLSSLQTIATAASAKGVSNSELTTLQKAFASGVSQVQSFINSSPFEEFQVGDGTVTARDQSTSAVPKTPTTYTTGLTAATADTVLPQLQGDVQFAATISLPNGSTPTTVNFNLADMGDTPRTLSNVVSYLNSQLQAAGSDITFGDKTVTTPAVTKTNTSGKTSTVTTITAATSQVQLQVLGNSLETVSFSAPSTSPAVYVAASSTAPSLGVSATSSTSSTTASTTSSKTSSTTASKASSTTSATATTTSQLLAFDPTGDNAVNTTNGALWTENLPSTATVDATATGADGSVYVLANLSGTTDGQSIQGAQTAALLKYDSAGNLVYQRQIGGINSASGYALAVSPDGSQVAIAGSTTTPTVLGASTSAYNAATQSTIAVYDSSSGNQLWTKTQKATGDNQINGVAFGSDNSVYVVGQTTGSLSGATSAGGQQEGYVEGLTATPKTTTSFVTSTVAGAVAGATTQTVTWTATNSFTTEFGTTGVNRATSVAVNGSSLYVSSVQNGDAVVSQYTTSSIGAPSLTATQDLGSLNGGNLSGIVVNADGSVSVAGTTSNGNLNGGSVTSAYGGGQNAFVAQLSASLDPQYLAYIDEGNATTATGIAVSNGQTYITGQVATGADPANGQVSEDGYVAQLDPTTGQVSWSQTFQGTNGNAAPVGVSVSQTGSSALTALGLPDGEINQATSTTLVANTSLQAGDKFYIQVGTSSPVPITITATDTYATLAKKIEAASGNRVVAKTTGGLGGTELVLTPLNTNATQKVAISAGPVGADALGPLGLKAGLITNASTSSNKATPTSDVAASTTNSLKAAYSVSLPTTLNLDSTTNIAAALAQVKTAASEVQNIFYNMTTPPTTSTSGATSSNTGLANIYKAQAKGYATALARLEGSSTSSSTPTSLIGLAALATKA